MHAGAMNTLRQRLITLATAALVAAFSTVTQAQTNMNSDIAPAGKLRVGINGSNPALYARAADGSPSGIAADLGRFIAARLGVPFDPVIYTSAGAFPQQPAAQICGTDTTGRGREYRHRHAARRQAGYLRNGH